MFLYVNTFIRPAKPALFAHADKTSYLLWRPVQAAFATLLMVGPTLADPLPSPAIASTLPANPNPFAVDTSLLGKVYISGQLTGLGLWQNHVVEAPGNGNDTYVKALGTDDGSAFGGSGKERDQVRVLAETGLMF